MKYGNNRPSSIRAEVVWKINSWDLETKETTQTPTTDDGTSPSYKLLRSLSPRVAKIRSWLFRRKSDQQTREPTKIWQKIGHLSLDLPNLNECDLGRPSIWEMRLRLLMSSTLDAQFHFSRPTRSPKTATNNSIRANRSVGMESLIWIICRNKLVGAWSKLQKWIRLHLRCLVKAFAGRPY